jgi:hypothetical protein
VLLTACIELSRSTCADVASNACSHAIPMPPVPSPEASAPSSTYSDGKVANRDGRIRDLALGDREWLLNDGHIQNPSAQS